MTRGKRSGGRCSVSAVVSAPSFRLHGRGGSPSGPKIQAQRAANPKSTIQNPSSSDSFHPSTFLLLPSLPPPLVTSNSPQRHRRQSTSQNPSPKISDSFPLHSPLATLSTAIQGELDRVSQTLTGRIRQLAERYAAPLPQLTDEVAALAAKVDGHLKKMGAAL